MMNQREQILRGVVRRLLREEIEGGGVQLVDVQTWQFPAWFQNLLILRNGEMTESLNNFNGKMYRAYETLRTRIKHGELVAQMFQSKDHPEFLSLYCSLINVINLETSVNQIVEYMKQIFEKWVNASQANRRLWLCLIGQINEEPTIEPDDPIKTSIGTQPHMVGSGAQELPRYISDEVKNLVERNVELLRLDDQQANILQNYYQYLTVMINEIAMVKQNNLTDSDVLNQLGKLLGKQLKPRQKKIIENGGQASDASNSEIRQAINTISNQGLLDDAQIKGVIQKHQLTAPITDDEGSFLTTRVNKLVKKLPSLGVLYQFIQSKNRNLDENVFKAYQELLTIVKGFLDADNLEASVKESNKLAVLKHLTQVILRVESLIEELSPSQGETGGEEEGGRIIADGGELGENSIHANQKILDDFVSGENLLNSRSFQERNIRFEMLRADSDFTRIFPENFLRLGQLHRQLEGLDSNSEKYQGLMQKYAALIYRTYPHYKNLLSKLEDGVFYHTRFVGSEGRTDIPKFLYQMLYQYENYMKAMPGEKLLDNIVLNAVDATASTRLKTDKYYQNEYQNSDELVLSQDFNIDVLKKDFVNKNNEEMEEYVKINLPDDANQQLGKYQGLISQKHPDLIQLNKGVNYIKKLFDDYNQELEITYKNNGEVENFQHFEEIKKQINNLRKKHAVKENEKTFFRFSAAIPNLYNIFSLKDWYPIIFKAFKNTVIYYLSVLKKVRDGVFDYIQNYGTIVKLFAYRLLYRWEKYVNKIGQLDSDFFENEIKEFKIQKKNDELKDELEKRKVKIEQEAEENKHRVRSNYEKWANEDRVKNNFEKWADADKRKFLNQKLIEEFDINKFDEILVIPIKSLIEVYNRLKGEPTKYNNEDIFKIINERYENEIIGSKLKKAIKIMRAFLEEINSGDKNKEILEKIKKLTNDQKDLLKELNKDLNKVESFQVKMKNNFDMTVKNENEKENVNEKENENKDKEDLVNLVNSLDKNVNDNQKIDALKKIKEIYDKNNSSFQVSNQQKNPKLSEGVLRFYEMLNKNDIKKEELMTWINYFVSMFYLIFVNQIEVYEKQGADLNLLKQLITRFIEKCKQQKIITN